MKLTILNFSYADIKDAVKFKQYLKAAAILMKEAGVEIVVRGDFSITMKGDKCAPHIAAVFRYPDKAAVDKFYYSEKYKVLIPLQDEACSMTNKLNKQHHRNNLRYASIACCAGRYKHKEVMCLPLQSK